MKKKFMFIILLISLSMPLNSHAGGKTPEAIDFESQGFTKTKTTAYCVGSITYNGSRVHEGGCASSKDHIGEVAILYTLNGDFIGYFECNDTGGTDAIKNGDVIDVYRANYERCVDYMNLTGGCVYVKWVKGVG